MSWFWFQSSAFGEEGVSESFDIVEARNRVYDLLWRPGESVSRPVAPLRVILLASITSDAIELPAENGYLPGGEVISFGAPSSGTGGNEQVIQFSGLTSPVTAVGCAIIDASMLLWQVIQFNTPRSITAADQLAIGTGTLSVEVLHTMLPT